MDLTKEILIEAANDLSRVCKLDPPFNIDMDCYENEADFIEDLKDEMIQFVEFKTTENDHDTYDFQAGDVVLIKDSTKEVIKELSPDTVKRLKEVFGVEVNEKLPAAPKPKKKTASGLVVKTLCSNFSANRTEIKEALRSNDMKMSDTYIDGWISEFGMIITELKEQGKLQ